MKLKVRCEIFFLFMTFFIIFCFLITPSFAQYPTSYGIYGSPYGTYSGYGGYPNYGYSRPQYYSGNPYTQPYYGAPYGGYPSGGFYSNVGYSQPPYHGGYPYNQSYYGAPYGGYQSGGYYPNPGFPQPPYYEPYSYELPPYDPFDWRTAAINGQSFLAPGLPPYNQSYYGTPYGGYQYGINNNFSPQSYYDVYGQYYQNSLQKLYEDADEELDEDDDGDDITLEEGETLSIILRSNQSQGINAIGRDLLDKGEWILDTDKLDSDIIKKTSDEYFPVPEGSVVEGLNLSIYNFEGREQWLFEAKNPGTTTIELNYTVEDYWGSESIQDTFEIEVTVVED